MTVKIKNNKAKHSFSLRRKSKANISSALNAVEHTTTDSLKNLKNATLHLEQDTVAYIKHNPYKVMAGSLLAGTLLTLYFLKDQLMHLK